MKKTTDYNSFLSPEGQIIYDVLMDHCNAKLKMMDVDNFELSMLANSFSLYADSAKICNESGVSMSFMNDKGGKYEQIRPEYTVMKNEYANILKHSAKFGLNPGDRMKIFKGVKEKKKDPAAGLD
jgi:phage terminase small subunit